MQKALRRAFSTTHKGELARIDTSSEVHNTGPTSSPTSPTTSPPTTPTSPTPTATLSTPQTSIHPRKRLSLFVKSGDPRNKPRSLSDVSDAEDFQKVQKRKSLFPKGSRESYHGSSASSSPTGTLSRNPTVQQRKSYFGNPSAPQTSQTTANPNRHTFLSTTSSPLPVPDPATATATDMTLAPKSNNLAPPPFTTLATTSEPNLTNPTSPTSKSSVRPSARSLSQRKSARPPGSHEPLPEPDPSSSPEHQADDYLQLGMQCHERGELEKATHYWRMAAERDSPLGLFFYGIALRHGWGCKANPSLAVHYLQKAAESAVFDLHTGIARNVSIARSELVLAIYELGVCFRHGWGVPKNKETAAYYFEIAANLGDPDAQNDLAFCYVHGHGVKKDMFRAAKYYRMAAKQGSGIMGNSWIYKKKYDVVEDKAWEAAHASVQAGHK